MGLRIQHLSGSRRGEILSVESGTITLGRRASHTIRFDSDRDVTVSGDHARIYWHNGEWVYRDLGSSNGSWINGQRVQKTVVRGGEEIELGGGGPVIRLELIETENQPLVEREDLFQGDEELSEPVGAKTVGMMIEAARSQARRGPDGRMARTSFIRSVAVEAARHGSRRFKFVVALVIVLLAGIITALIVELQRTRLEIHEITQAKMGPSEIGERIFARNSMAIYLLIYRTNKGFEQGFCTGFAVSVTDLMTNAHCVAEIQKYASQGASFFAAPNEGRGARYRLVSWRSHPKYDQKSPRPTPDIGVVTVGGRLPAIVPLADRKHLKGLRPGAQIFVFGFPGDLSDVSSPVATLTAGVLGRLTALGGRAAPLGKRFLLQYSAFTSKGTSGSPVFDKFGKVVAVNSGYYQGRSRVTIQNPETGKAEQANVPRDLSGYSFGIRVDLAAQVPR